MGISLETWAQSGHRYPMSHRNSYKEVLLPHIHRLLSSRDHPKTICPSEVPRALTATELKAIEVSNWRELMPEVSEILWEMRQKGEVEILQQGSLVPDGVALEDVKGPIRARKAT